MGAVAVRARHGAEVATLAHAWREFRTRRSPRILLAGLALAAAARVALGRWGWPDAVAAAAMVAVYPFAEWVIHQHLLHLRPFTWRGREVELVTATAHRAHHEDPHDLGMILLGPVEAVALLLGLLPLVVLAGCAPLALVGVGVPLGAAATAGLAGCALILNYEWTHFVIHTAHRPRTRWFAAVHRSHRLHHFKNEHYWHGITSTLGDRVLGTFPDQTTVERSPTARTLRPAPDR